MSFTPKVKSGDVMQALSNFPPHYTKGKTYMALFDSCMNSNGIEYMHIIDDLGKGFEANIDNFIHAQGNATPFTSGTFVPKFKKGDILVCVNNNYAFNLIVGAEYTCISDSYVSTLSVSETACLGTGNYTASQFKLKTDAWVSRMSHNCNTQGHVGVEMGFQHSNIVCKHCDLSLTNMNKRLAS